MANYDLQYEGPAIDSILDTGKKLEDDGYIFLGLAAANTTSGTPDKRVFYFAGPGSYSGFSVTIPTGAVGIFAYNGSAWVTSVINTGSIYDVSSANSGRTYASLSTAIEDIPSTARKAGMEIKFVNTSTSKYEVWIYQGTSTSAVDFTNTANWIGVDETPLSGSNNLVSSGGVYEAIQNAFDKLDMIDSTGTSVQSIQINVTLRRNDGTEEDPDWQTVASLVLPSATTTKAGLMSADDKAKITNTDGVFDISEYTASGGTPTQYASLSAALGTNGINVPQNIRKGGMSVKFVQSSDNKYVQYRLMATSWSTTVSDWQGVDDEPKAGSPNLVKSGCLASLNAVLCKNYYEHNYTIVSSTSIFNAPGCYLTNGSGFLCVYGECNDGSVEKYTVAKTGYGILAIVDVNKVIIIDLSKESSSLSWVKPVVQADQALGNGTLKLRYFTVGKENVLYNILSEIYNNILNKDEVPTSGSDKFVESNGVYWFVKGLTDIVTTQQLIIEDEIEHSAIATNGDISNISADNNLSIRIYPCTPGGNIKIEGDIVGWDRLAYAFYSSNQISSTTAVLLGDNVKNTSTSNPTHISKSIVVPQNAYYVAVTSYNASMMQGTPLMVYNLQTENVAQAIIELREEIQKDYLITYSNNSVVVERNYPSGQDGRIAICISKVGPNNLMQLSGISYNGGSYIGANSDWIGPYVMTADENGNENRGFTGGWHGYNGNQTGSATARTDSFQIEIDNKIIGSVGNYEGNRVKLIVTNYIQAGNTKEEDGTGREVVKEVVTYEFYGNKLNVSVETTALEAIHINTYYGMQITGYNTKYKFIGDTTVFAPQDGSTVFNYTHKARKIIGYSGTTNCVCAYMEDIGLGTYFNIPSDKKTAFCQGYGDSGYSKAYYNLINSGVAGASELAMLQGDMMSWSGYYEFFPNT